MGTFFDSPAYKLEIRDLLNAKEEKGDGRWTLVLKSDSLLPKGTSKMIPLKEITLQLNIIWIQGVVLDILGEGHSPSTLHLSDTTGEAFLHEYNLLPGGDHPKITKGAYVGVIGQIWSIEPMIVIKGAKVMCLEEKPVLKQLWSDEVAVAKAFLLDILIPDVNS